MHPGGSDGGAAHLAPVIAHAHSARSRTGCEVESDGSRTRVRLWGALPFTWCGNLSLHCHGAGVSIVEADARHLGSARWAASVLVEPAGEGRSLHGLDFLAMARHRPALVPLAPRLERARFRLDPPSEDRCARLCLSAPDRLGLLAALLEAIVASGLRPRALTVRTRDGQAQDCFELEAAAGTRPTERSLADLEVRLRGRPGAVSGYLNK